jgi:glucosyl-dolichyl phosphate glucuronosyltransferase
LKSPSLTTIVCTYNRAFLLKNCLDSLAGQTLDKNYFEVIVVDNNSKDSTEQVVREYCQKYQNFRYVFEKEQGLSHARNRGCAEAKTEYLVYLDDDVIAPAEYLSNVLKVVNQYSPDIMGGPVYPYYTSKKPEWFKDEYEIRKNADESGFCKNCNISGGNFIIKKSVLEKLGMFDPSYGMIGNKLRMFEERRVLEKYRAATPESKQKVYYALECFIKHHVPEYKMKISYLVKRSFQGGKGLSEIDIQITHNNSVKDAIQSKSLMKQLTYISDKIKQKGIRNLDYVAGLRFVSVSLGKLVGIVTHKVKSDQ